MKNRDIGAEILEGIGEIQEYKKGRIKLKATRLSAPSEPEAIRSRFGTLTIGITKISPFLLPFLSVVTYLRMHHTGMRFSLWVAQ